MNPLIVGAAAFLLTACAEPQADPAASLEMPDTLVVTSDPELRAMAESMLPGLAARSGLGLRAPVRLERRSRAALEDYLRVKLDEELPPGKAENLARAYHLLGMAPAELDLRELLLSVYMEQVAGFYDPDSTALFVLDDQPAETLRALLLHELVHAVQDQWADLDALTAPELGNDRRTAAQAAIEGHATLVMLEYMTEQLRGQEVDLSEVPDMADQLRPALEAVRTQYPALARAPEVIQQGLLLPYLEGAGFVLALWRALPERAAPFGEHLPASTEQVMDPARFVGDPVDAPTEVGVEVAAGRALESDVLGRAEAGVLIQELGGDAAAADGWDGDRWVLVAPEDGGDSGLAWASVWDSPEDRARFAAALRAGLPALPVPAELEEREVDGRPVLVLRVGGTGEVAVTLEGGSP